MVRIAKPSYGPLNPPLRPEAPDVGAWGRWDIPNGRTIYAVDDVGIAYREVLAYLAPAVGVRNTKLADIFVEDEDAADDPRTLLTAITTEWEELWRIDPHKIVRGWRDARRLYVLTPPETGWIVDIEHQESIDALNLGLAQVLAKAGLSRLTCAHLLGEDRRLTVLAASWVHRQVLDDGSLPHGINFSSKHGSNGVCWAIWLRRIDDGHDASRELTKVKDQQLIEDVGRNPDLKAAADAFGLTIL